MDAKVEVTIKFDGARSGEKLTVKVPHVESKWLKKDLHNMAKWEKLVLDGLRAEFPQAQ